MFFSNFSDRTLPRILIILYSLIFLIGELGTMDRLGPQTFALNILNTLVLIYIFFRFKSSESSKSLKISYDILNLNLIPFYYLLILSFAVISLYFTINLSESIIVLSHYISVILSFFCLLFLISEVQDIKKLFIPFIVLLLAIESLYVFYSIIKYYVVYDHIFGNWGRTFEIRGFTANINITAFSIAYKLPFLIYLACKQSLNKKLVIVLSFLILIVIINIFHLASRGGILSMLLSFFLFFCFYAISNRKKLIYLTSIFVLGFSFSYFILKGNELNPIDRTSSININTQDGSVNQRLRYYKGVLKYVLDNPFKPIGIGMYKLKSIEFEKNEIRQYIVPYHTHNDFLEIWIESGFISFLSYSLIFIILIKNALMRLLIKKNVYYLPILCFFVTYLLDSLLNFPIARPVSFLFFNLVATFSINDSKN